MTSYYEYVHRPGFGRADHLADEIIARAARHLGARGCDGYIAACVGLASHAAPMPGASVRLAAGPGVRRRMVAALRAAERELFGERYVDTWIVVECVRTRCYRRGEQVVRVHEVRRGRRWEEVEK